MLELPQALTFESAKEYIEGAIRETPPLEFAGRCSVGADLNGFDWRNYIEIKKLNNSISDKEFEVFKADMETVLDKLSTLPEIQQCLESNRQLYSTSILGYIPLPSKIVLSPENEVGVLGSFDTDNSIRINPWNLAHTYSINDRGESDRASVYRILGHEIFHAGDPRVKAVDEAINNLQAMGIVYGEYNTELLNQAFEATILINENAAVTKLEAKISTLVGEVAKTDYYDDTHYYYEPYNGDFASTLMPEVEMTLPPGAISANWGCGVTTPGR